MGGDSGRNSTTDALHKVLGMDKFPGCLPTNKAETVFITEEQLDKVLEIVRDRLTGSTDDAKKREILGTCRSCNIVLKK